MTPVVPVVVRVRLCAPERMKLFAPIVYVEGSTGVPVNVGEIESTRFPVPVTPVISDTDEARFAAVMVDTRFFEASVATRRDAVRPENESVPVALMFATERSPDTRASPCTERVFEGVVVPMPTLPALVIRILSTAVPEVVVLK